ncbi:MAG: hypothetical protein ABWY12_08035 [Burkholderiales bacterium]
MLSKQDGAELLDPAGGSSSALMIVFTACAMPAPAERETDLRLTDRRT